MGTIVLLTAKYIQEETKMEQQLLTEDAIRAFQDDLILEEKSGATL